MPLSYRVLLALSAASFTFLGCAPECVDLADCGGIGAGMTCQAGKCVAGSPFPDAGTSGGGGGATGGGGGGGSTGGGGGGAVDAGQDAGIDAGTEMDAGMDAGVDAGVDAGLSPGDTLALTSAGRLITFNLAQGAVRTATAVTGLQGGEVLLGLDVRPGGTTPNQAIALGSSGRLYVIDPSTAAATVKATLIADPNDATAAFTALTGAQFGIDFNPAADRLRVVSNTSQNLRINADTGATITDGDLNVAATPRAGVTAVAYTNSFSTTCRTALFYVDTTTDELFTTTAPNGGALTLIGALGVNADAVSAFDIVTASAGTNRALASLTVGGTNSLYEVNLTTGAATSLVAFTGLMASETVMGLALTPPATAPVQAPGELVGLTIAGNLVTFNAGAPQQLCTGPTLLTGLNMGDAVVGIDTRPATGELFALTRGAAGAGRLYTVNVATAVATPQSALAADSADLTAPYTQLVGASFGVDFNPTVDRLRVVSEAGQNLRINPASGLVTSDQDVNPASSRIAAAGYVENFAGASVTTLYGIDTGTDGLVTINPPNNGTVVAVGALGTAFTDNVAFDIATTANVAYLAGEVSGTLGVSSLFTVNLTTGLATRVNTIKGAEVITALTARGAQRAVAFGVTTDNRLISFAPNAPATLTLDVAITGLMASENIVGIDFRPATGALIALTNQNRLYVLDTTTGAAMSGLVMSGATLDGTAFGIDFNPTVDRLRIVSTIPAAGAQLVNEGQNLRVNVVTGGATVDGRISTLATNISLFGAGYTNNFVGATATTLYYLDSGSNRLLTNAAPNLGTTTDVGPLGVDVTDVGDLDIAGLNNNLVLAAMQVTAAAGSTLYRIDLATGTATPVAAIGATTPVIGLAIRFQ